MIWPFKKRFKSFLGIDIGTSTMRVVEASKYGDQEKLENYAYLSIPAFPSGPFRAARKGSLVFSSKRLSELIARMVGEAKMESRRAVFSIPDFSTLFTTFTLPHMAEEEIPQAVRFEARRHVPLPLSEVTLDWLSRKIENEEGGGFEILLVVVPNRIIDQYMEIARLAEIQMVSLEAEAFSLQRALVGKSKETVCLIDIGAQSTTCNIIDQGLLRISHSFDIAGNDLTERISKSLNIEYSRAEVIKINRGMLDKENKTDQILKPLLGMIISEVKRVIEIFYEKEGKDVQKYIISGSSGSLLGLKEYFSQALNSDVKIAFPFKNMIYPTVLEQELRKIGPGFSIAVGTALKALE
jgi:type IV pilus assembly protein PilM